MILTLEVAGAQAGTLGSASRKVFRATGGSIGRLSSNFWVLPHPYVSSRHALIRYENDVFTIEDTKSSNGIFINSPENRLPMGARHRLKDGDSIFIDPFEIHASVASEPASVGHQPLPDDPFGADDPFGLPAPAPAAPPARPRSVPVVHDSVPGEEVDPMNLLGFDDPPAPSTGVPRAANLAGGSALSDHYAPPPVPSPPASPAPSGPSHLIPEDYNPLLGDDQQSAPSPPPAARPAPRPVRPAPPAAQAPADTGPHVRPVRPRPTSPGMKRPDLTHAGSTRQQAPPQAPAPAAPSARHGRSPGRETPPVAGANPSADLAAMLAGAGLDPGAVTPELARNLGQILRVVVSGVMDVLQARQRIKDEFGMRMTTFRPADNNPLKFSANVEDALHNLLVKRNAAYLGPVEAFEDAFVDVRNHQMAMLAGMRVAFETMLAAFDPDRLQEEFDRQGKKGSLLTVPAKLRYWDLFRDKFGDMVKDAEATFTELFGDEFARAYEEQLERLRSRGRPDTR